jgi:hypothetical protein
VLDQLEAGRFDFGYELRDPWPPGCFAVHCGDDKYRLIWKVYPEEDDYSRPEGSKVIPIVVLRLGPKTSYSEGTLLYDEPPSELLIELERPPDPTT